MTCPTCKKNQKVGKSVEKFRTNEYIIDNIRERRKSSSHRTHEKGMKFSMCPSHVQELRLYCPADQCKKAICLTCLMNDHAAHTAEVEDLTEKKELLLANISSVSKDLEKAKTDCLKIKEFVSKENEKCIASIKARKEEICAEFDAMIEEVSDFTPEVIQTIQTFEEFLTSLEKMGSCQMSFEEIRADSESVENIRKSSRKKLSNTIRYYKYSRNSVFGELKITNTPLDSPVKENTEN